MPRHGSRYCELEGRDFLETGVVIETRKMETNRIERRLRISGLLIVTGLCLGLLTLFWTHPLAFVAFAALACPLVLFGCALPLLSTAKRVSKVTGLANWYGQWARCMSSVEKGKRGKNGQKACYWQFLGEK